MKIPLLQNCYTHCFECAARDDSIAVMVQCYAPLHTTLRWFSLDHGSWLLAWDHILVAIRGHFDIIAVLVVRIAVSFPVIARRVCAS